MKKPVIISNSKASSAICAAGLCCAIQWAAGKVVAAVNACPPSTKPKLGGDKPSCGTSSELPVFLSNKRARTLVPAVLQVLGDF
jgi:hypothetical protein